MLHADRTIKCSDCGTDFVFTAGEQAFYEERNFRFPPRRCKECRQKKKDNPGGDGAPREPRAGREGREGGGESKETWPATCTSCGATTTVPFKPDPQRPTFCRKCYAERRATSRSRG